MINVRADPPVEWGGRRRQASVLRHRQGRRGRAAGTRLSCSAVPQWASFSQALHRIACVISLMLHGRRNYNPHSRARHPAV
jgi:hypothetical protein